MRILLAALATLALVPAAAQAAPSAFERQVFAELNGARLQPQALSQSLRRTRALFTGEVAHEAPGDLGQMTHEGAYAFDDAIRFVDGQGRLPALVWDEDLAGAAADHADEQSLSGGFGHRGASGVTLGRRVASHVTGKPLLAEVISYGQTSPLGVVRQLVVDDGLPRRPHRNDLFDPALHHVGVACRPHPLYGSVCVIDLSAN